MISRKRKKQLKKVIKTPLTIKKKLRKRALGK